MQRLALPPSLSSIRFRLVKMHVCTYRINDERNASSFPFGRICATPSSLWSIWHSCNFETGAMFNDTNPRYPRSTVLHCGIPSFIRRIPTRDSLEPRRRRGFVFPSISLASRYKNDNKTTSYRFRAIPKLPSYVVLRTTPLYLLIHFQPKFKPLRLLVSRVTRACLHPPSFPRFYDRNRRGESLWLHRCQMEG